MNINGYEIAPDANLSSADLRGARLQVADLSSADLYSAVHKEERGINLLDVLPSVRLDVQLFSPIV